MIRSVNFLICASIWLVVLALFDHTSSRDYGNYILALLEPSNNIQFNSIYFWLYSRATHAMQFEPVLSYHIFQFISFTLFSNALLKLMNYDLFKYIICMLLLTPVFVPLYFLVQIKMGFSISLFIWAITLKTSRTLFLNAFAIFVHLYALMLLYFTKFNPIKGPILQVFVLVFFAVVFILISPRLGYGILFLLGHQEKLNLLNSLFLIFNVIALAALLTGKNGSDKFNLKSFAIGGFVIYVTAYILQYPVVGIRTLELFSCISAIWLFKRYSRKSLVYIVPVIFSATAFHTYYMYFVFRLFS